MEVLVCLHEEVGLGADTLYLAPWGWLNGLFATGDGRYQNLVGWGACELEGRLERLRSTGAVTEVLEGEGFVIFAVYEGLGDYLVEVGLSELSYLAAALLQQGHPVYLGDLWFVTGGQFGQCACSLLEELSASVFDNTLLEAGV